MTYNLLRIKRITGRLIKGFAVLICIPCASECDLFGEGRIKQKKKRENDGEGGRLTCFDIGQMEMCLAASWKWGQGF